MEYQKFPQPEQLKTTDDKFTLGMNKSGRQWKVGANRNPMKNCRNKGARLSWEQKKKLSEQKKKLRQQGKTFRSTRQQKRKENKQRAKQRKRQRQLNQIRAGKFEVIKNTKGIKKWNKKMKQQLIKLPAQVYEALSAPK